jgi:phosphate acyltransferase
MTIILDAMGSDNYPDPEIQGAVIAAELFGEEIILIGHEDILKPKLNIANPKKLPILIEHAPDVLEMEDKAVAGATKKPNNSMAVGLKLMKSGRGQAFVSAGNTGGVMFNAMRALGRIKGVQRPGLTTLFPTKKGRCIVLDIGANADCRPIFLLQFAMMGSIYAQYILGIPNPRIGLVSNGEEAGKGNQLIKETYPLLQKSGLNFYGNVEGKELFGGEVDVAITDGFTGNVLLKTSEAVGRLLIDSLTTELSASLITKIGAGLAMPAFKKLKKLMNPEEVGAAALLGIDGLVFVGHGRSNATAIVSAIRVARSAVQANLLEKLRENIQKNQALFEIVSPQA